MEGLVYNLPDGTSIQTLLLLTECCYSRQIDYPDISFSSFLENRGNGDTPINRLCAAYELSLKIKNMRDALEEAYTLALHDPDTQDQKRIRTTPFFMAETVLNYRRYNPTAPGHITPALNDLFNYMAQDSSDPLIKAALVHYQFEMIHPFDSYNGIMGRLLICKALLHGGLPVAHLLALSEVLFESTSTYFDLLATTQRSGGYLQWIKFFISAIRTAALRRVAQIKQHQRIVAQDEARILNHPAASKSTLKVLEHWKRHLVSTIGQGCEDSGLAFNTVERGVQALQDLGILKQMAPAQRGRKFVYSALADIFLEPQR